MRKPICQRVVSDSVTAMATCVLWLGAPSGNSALAVSCRAITSPNILDAGTVIPWRSTPHSVTGNISIDCTNTANFNYQTTVCLSVGPGDAGISITQRQISAGGAPTDPAMSINITSNNLFFGSYFHGKEAISSVPVTVPRGGITHAFDIPITLTVTGGQVSAVPGTYISSFRGSNTALAVDSKRFVSPNCRNTMPVRRNTFSFAAIATVPDFCEFTSSIPAMSFPLTAGISETSQSASTEMSVRCTNTTPYTINLRPSNNNASGQGEMASVDAPNNTDTVPYTLHRDSAGQINWGDLPGNGLSSIGNGDVQRWTVHSMVSGHLNVTPGNYRDNVIVTVTY